MVKIETKNGKHNFIVYMSDEGAKQFDKMFMEALNKVLKDGKRRKQNK